MTDGRGVTSTFTYDHLDRLVRIDYPDRSRVAYAYDGNGNLRERRDAAGTWSFDYDPLNRMIRQHNPTPAETITYDYDRAGNLTGVTDAGGTTTYGYDEVNLMTGLTDPDGERSTFSYNDRYLRTRATYPGGLKLGFAWDDSRRMCRMAATTGTLASNFGCDTAVASPMELFSYDYTSPQNLDTPLRHTMTDKAGRETTYSYDKVARLTGAETVNSSGAQVSKFTYHYDPNGNLTREVDTGKTTHFTYGAGNELTCTFPQAAGSCGGPGTVTFDYDPAGNLASTSEGLSLSYNDKGQTTTVRPPGGSQIPMSYGDADQVRRVRAGGKQFSYSQLGLTGEVEGSSRTSFVRDPEETLLYQRTPQGPHYVIPDALGSTVGLVDRRGARVATYAYEPYGELTTSTGTASTPFRFASGYFDQAWGATKFGTRYYQAGVARWTQPDPDFGFIAAPLSLNRYSYVESNPVNSTDPTGRCVLSCINEKLAAAGVNWAILSLIAIICAGVCVFTVGLGCLLCLAGALGWWLGTVAGVVSLCV